MSHRVKYFFRSNNGVKMRNNYSNFFFQVQQTTQTSAKNKDSYYQQQFTKNRKSMFDIKTLLHKVHLSLIGPDRQTHRFIPEVYEQVS